MKVLVVDDTKNIRSLLTKCLTVEGCDVTAVGEGKTALGLFAREHYDLVFLDIKMPFFSGTEVLRRMREMGVSTPVIIITAYATIKNAVECTGLGAVAYLQKPFTSEKIKNVLSELGMAFPEGNVSPAAGSNPLTPAPQSADAFVEAQAYLEAKKPREAEEILARSLAGHTLSAEFCRLMALACRGQGRMEDALKYEAAAKALG